MKRCAAITNFISEVTALKAEALRDTQTSISCVITGLTRELDEVVWEKPNSGGVINHGTDGYEIDEGTYDNETLSQTTVLIIPADKNTADSVYTCVISSNEHQIFQDRTDAPLSVYSKFFFYSTIIKVLTPI